MRGVSANIFISPVYYSMGRAIMFELYWHQLASHLLATSHHPNVYHAILSSGPQHCNKLRHLETRARERFTISEMKKKLSGQLESNKDQESDILNLTDSRSEVRVSRWVARDIKLISINHFPAWGQADTRRCIPTSITLHVPSRATRGDTCQYKC